MNLNDRIERSDVPTYTGRLYTDALIDNGGLFGNWVRRAEVDALLDENLALKRQLQALKGTTSPADACFEVKSFEGVSTAFAHAEQARKEEYESFLQDWQHRQGKAPGSGVSFGAGWDARVRYDRAQGLSEAPQRPLARLTLASGLRAIEGTVPLRISLYEPVPPPGEYDLYGEPLKDRSAPKCASESAGLPDTRMERDLKVWPEFFEKLKSGAKTFELRKNDRGYEVGDTLLLREWNPLMECYTGEALRRRVTYIFRGPGFGIEEGYAVLALKEIPQPGADELSEDTAHG
jgi:hypothetical protein